MEDPMMLLVPDVPFHGSPGESYRAQVGPETIDGTKWVPVRWWGVFTSHGVIGLRYSFLSQVIQLDLLTRSRFTGKDR